MAKKMNKHALRMRRWIKSVREHIAQFGFIGLECSTTGCTEGATSFCSPKLECPACREIRLEKRREKDRTIIEAKKARRDKIIAEGVENHECDTPGCTNPGHKFGNNYKLNCLSHHENELAGNRFRDLKKVKGIKRSIGDHFCKKCGAEAKDIYRGQPYCIEDGQVARMEEALKKKDKREEIEENALEIHTTIFPNSNVTKETFCEATTRSYSIDLLRKHGIPVDEEVALWVKDTYTIRSPHKGDMLIKSLGFFVEWKNTKNTCSKKQAQEQIDLYKKGLEKMGLTDIDMLIVSTDGSVGMNLFEYYCFLETRLKVKKREGLSIPHSLTREVRELKERAGECKSLFETSFAS